MKHLKRFDEKFWFMNKKDPDSDYMDSITKDIGISYKKTGENNFTLSKNDYKIYITLSRGDTIVRPSYNGIYYESESHTRNLDMYLKKFDFNKAPIDHKKLK